MITFFRENTAIFFFVPLISNALNTYGLREYYTTFTFRIQKIRFHFTNIVEKTFRYKYTIHSIFNDNTVEKKMYDPLEKIYGQSLNLARERGRKKKEKKKENN